MDLSKLSDSDLQALQAGKLDQVSDEGLAYLQSQSSAPEAPVAELNLAEKALVKAAPILIPAAKVMDVATLGAPIRAGVAKAVEMQTGQEIAPEKKLLRGEAPTFSEIWEAEGVPSGPALSEMVPGMFSETGEGLPLKKGGMFDVTPRGVLGGIMDIATAPGQTLTKPVTAAIAKSGALAKIPSSYSIMSAVSGIPKEAIETYAKNKKLVGSLDQAAAEELTQQAAMQARGAVDQARKQAGKALQSAMEQAGNKTVSIVDLKKTLEQAAAVPKGALKNQEAQKMYAEMQNKVKSLLTRLEETPETLSLSPEGILEKVPAGVAEVPISTELTAQQLFDMKQQLKEMADAYGGRGGLLSKLAAKDAPMVSKKFEADMTGAIKKIDDLIDTATSGASAEARANYARLSKTADNADRYFSTPEKVFGTLSNISSRAKAPARRIMQQADKQFGTSLEKTGKVIESAKYFNQPVFDAISSQSVTSTARALRGASLGAAAGGALFGGSGAGIGAYVGGGMTSPWAVKNVLLPASELASKVPGAVGGGIQATQKYAPAQLWLQMLQEQQKQGEQR